MSSVGLSGLSNISSDTLQGRYEKALKQINKLIEINRELKEKIGEYERNMQEYQQQIQRLEKVSHELDDENNLLDSKYMQLAGHCEELEAYCKKLEAEIDRLEAERKDIDERLETQESKYHEDIENEIAKNDTLAREAEYFQHAYEESMAAINVQEESIRALEKELLELRRENGQLKEANGKLSEVVTDKHIMKTQSELDQANTRIERLMKECSELKAKEIDFEVIEEKQRVEKYIGLGNSINEQQGDAVKELIQQYKRKIKEQDNEKKELQQKYRHIKSKLTRMQANDKYQKKIESLERLTEKQQREIARIIETYDRELNAIHKENVKIKESYSSLSQILSKKGAELGEKERAISQLKMTKDRYNFEIQSLRKANSSLLSERQSKVRELSHLKNQIQNTESITIGQLRTPQSDEASGNVKMKISQVQKGMHTAPAGLFEKEEPFITTSFQTKDQQKIPIKVSYPTSEKGDFKFIQSVNIINGYNVSLSENPSRASQ